MSEEDLEYIFGELSLEVYSEFEPSKYYYILSIDCGVKNLGLSLSSVNHDYTFNEIIWFDRVDITNFNHNDDWTTEDCELYHEKTLTDYLDHILYIHHELFSYVNFILIERQPICSSMLAVEQLIFSKYRIKSVLISPNSMHAWMGWNKLDLDYERRKIYSTEFALQYLKRGNRRYLVDIFNNMDRKHDIADSICIMIFYISIKNSEWKEAQYQVKVDQEIEYARKNGLYHSAIYLEKFRFKPNTTLI